MDLAELADKAIHILRRGKGYLDHGSDGIIYTVTEEVVLKLHTGSHHGSPKRSAQYESELGVELYKKKVQVPQYLGLFGPAPLSHRENWGVFMQRINGLELSSLSTVLHLEAHRQYQEQRSLIETLGYEVGDGKNMYTN